MKTKTKALTLALCAVLLVVTTVFVTVAYLTSEDSVTNTFTVGKVTITLDEADVDLMGVKDGDARVKENEYKLIPSHTYVKDPTIHVDSNSEDCYLFVKVENGLVSVEADGNTTIAKQMENKGWFLVNGTEDVYYYGTLTTIAAVNGGQDKVVFNEFTIDDSVEADDLVKYADKKIKVTAYAIQAEGFEDTDIASIWAKIPE